MTTSKSITQRVAEWTADTTAQRYGTPFAAWLAASRPTEYLEWICASAETTTSVDLDEWFSEYSGGTQLRAERSFEDFEAALLLAKKNACDKARAEGYLAGLRDGANAQRGLK